MKNDEAKNIDNDNNDCKINCQKLYTGIPLFIKMILLITVILYIINIKFSNISFYLSNIPYYTIYKYQLWRIFSTSLMTTNIINIILSILFWVKHASNLEDIMGTIIYLIIVIMNSTIIHLISTFSLFIISIIIKKKEILKAKINDKGTVNNSGLWPYIICELTLLSLSNPYHPIKFLFFPEFQAKFYPIIVLALFCILNNIWIDFEVLSGIIYAFIYHFLIKKKLKISKIFVRKIENLGCVKCFKIFGGFVSVNKNKYSSKDTIRRERKVIVNQSNMKGFVPLREESVIKGESARDINDAQKNQNNIQKSQNETLDVKIQ